MDQPKNITVNRIYEPDMQAMVRALRLVLGLEPVKKAPTKKREELAG